MSRVLIVDDHTVVRHGIKAMLAQMLGEVEVTEATDGRQAIQLLMDRRFDLVMLDLNLPDRSGLEVLHEAQRLCPKTPVLVLSAYAEEQFALRAFKSGASGYINKQCPSEELALAVKKLLAGGKYVTTSWAEKMVAAVGGDLSHAPHEALSDREYQILRMVAMGKTLKEIAVGLCLSEKTVGVYRSRITKKMGLSSNVDLTRYAVKHNLVD